GQAMRVIVNQLSALGRKTGIGHYAAELLRCLQTNTESERIDGFAPPWIRRSWEVWRELKDQNGERTAGGRKKQSALRSPLSALSTWVRDAGQAVLAHHFRTLCAREGYDLYHEPNYIPLPCDVPTVATLADLSVLLQPAWHPADRVAYYE